MKTNLSYKNRKAYFNYEVLDKYTAGIILVGSEVKSIRENGVSFNDSYCYFNNKNELVLKNLHIAEYKQSSYQNHEPLRERILLLNKKEVYKIKENLQIKHLTLVPVSLFFNDRNMIKVEIALCKGKKLYDKRISIKKRDQDRDFRKEI
jgi:SsrA-binding protein